MLNPADSHRVRRALSAFAQDAELCFDNREGALELARNIVKMRKQDAGAIPTVVVEFMQFYLGTRCLLFFTGQQDWSEIGDWLVWSLSDEIEQAQVRDLIPARLVAFLEDPVLLSWPAAIATILHWLGILYYYARRRATMENVARELWGISNAVFQADIAAGRSEEGVTLGAMCLGWCTQEAPDLAEGLASKLEAIVIDSKIDARARAKLGVALATKSARHTSRHTHEWAGYVLSELSENLQGHERLQMLIGCLPHTYTAETKEAVLKEVAHIQSAIPAESRMTVSGRRTLDNLSDLLLAILGTAMTNHDISFVILTMQRWYGIEPSAAGHLNELDIVSIAPISEGGFQIESKEHQFFLLADRQDVLVELTSAYDQFAGTSNSVAGAAAVKINIPDRFGVPDDKKAGEFAAAMAAMYFPAEAMDSWRSLRSDAVAQLLLPSMPHPLQALQRLVLGHTWPLVASLQKALPDRPIRRVTIWSGAGSFTEELEIGAVRALFESAGAVVEVHCAESSSVADFVAAYSDAGVDVFWVSSHGEFDHWYPRGVAIQISRSRNFVGLDSLLAVPINFLARRLLVLNVCDGGRFEQTGALPRIGFAPALAGGAQAVISHLWPTKGIAAAVMGVLLASHLAKGKPYFLAYQEMLADICASSQAVAENLDKLLREDSELPERVAGSQEDFLNIANNGSAVFFQ